MVAVCNPRQAFKEYSQSNFFPRQRNAFLVRFVLNGAHADPKQIAALSFVAKMVDRPKINPKIEELHQYNKKRQIHTGFKLEPVRMTFYDSADGAAQRMWTSYARYYFGDFNENVAKSYVNDVIAPEFLDTAHTGFGFIAPSPLIGGTADPGGNFFFNRIEIFHFYNHKFDQYTLTNPRITIYEPDDLDYENSAISLITMTIVYENLQYSMQNAMTNGEFDEFATGATFDGDALAIPNTMVSAPVGGGEMKVKSSSTPVQNLLGPNMQIPMANSHRSVAQATGSGLAQFGNFSFGAAVATTPARNNAVIAVEAARAGAVSSGSGTAAPTIASALLATNHTVGDHTITPTVVAMLSHGDGAPTLQMSDGSIVKNGVVLKDADYGAINAQQTGTAQYGINR